MTQVFDFTHYQAYLAASLPTTGEKRGIRSMLAKHIGCRTSHITQVISGHTQLSLELASEIALFLKLSNEETHYFTLLVSKDRAGTKNLSDYYLDQLDTIKTQRLKVSNRVHSDTELSLHDAAEYYSSWHYSAIHILVSLPEVNTKNDIYNHVKLPMHIINKVLEFLVKKSIVKYDKTGLKTTGKRLHLKASDALITKHHTNWRLKAIEESGFENPANLHFSSIYSLSKDDGIKLRSMITNFLEQVEKTVKPSPPEKLNVLLFDYFSMTE